MRYAVVLFAVWLAACSTTPGTDVLAQNNEPVERCEDTNCFNQLAVRDFEVVDPTTLVLYVGSQRCPFKVGFQGVFCDLTFLPGNTIEFDMADAQRARRAVQPTGRMTDLRICSFDRNVGIADDPFSRAGGGVENDPTRLPCEIQDVEALTDDELIELYVENRMAAPPPPFGTGQVSAPEAEDAAEEGGEASGEESVLPDADEADEAGTDQPTVSIPSL